MTQHFQYFGAELALVQQIKDACGADGKGEWREEPQDDGKGHVVRPQAVVKRLGGQSDDAAGAVGEFLTRRFTAFEHLRVGRRGDQQRAEGVLPHRPGKAEEGVDEDGSERKELEIEHECGRACCERDLAHELRSLFRCAEQCEQTADDQDRRRCEEGRAGRQVLHDDAVDDAVLARGGLHHPESAVVVGRRQQRPAG